MRFPHCGWPNQDKLFENVRQCRKRMCQHLFLCSYVSDQSHYFHHLFAFLFHLFLCLWAYLSGSQPGCRDTVPWDSGCGAARYHFLLTFSPILKSKGATKYWYSWPRVPRGKKGWATLVYLNGIFSTMPILWVVKNLERHSYSVSSI